MSTNVVVSFGVNREYSFIVHANELSSISKDEAQEWLAEEFEDLECSPSNPVGKILLVDMILNVAKYGGEDRFKEKSAWAQEFASMVAVLLKRSTIRVDISEFSVA